MNKVINNFNSVAVVYIIEEQAKKATKSAELRQRNGRRNRNGKKRNILK